MITPPLIFIVVLNWNGLADTSECLTSLADATYPNFRVLVVDNGSRDAQAEALREFCAARPALRAEVLETGANLGFTGGNNVAIREALARGADYVLCLNNDTIAAPDFLEPLVGALESAPDVGAAVSKIYLYDEPEQVWYAGAECSLEFVTLQSRGIPAWHLTDEEQNQGEEPFATRIATGCALMVRAEIMRELQGFDDRYFAYYEDVDLSLRMEKLGWRRLVVPASRVWHKESRSTGGRLSPTAMFYLIRNASLLATAHAPAGEAYYRMFARTRFQEVRRFLVHSADPRDARRAESIILALWSARGRRFGRRRDHPLAAAAAWLGLKLLRATEKVLGVTYYRVYWYLKAAHVRRGPRVAH